jgi:hypothetical protein
VQVEIPEVVGVEFQNDGRASRKVRSGSAWRPFATLREAKGCGL